MKVTQMPPVHAANLVVNSGKAAYGVDVIDLINKSQNVPVPYPSILYSEQKCAYFCSEWSIVGYGAGASWDLWNWSIDIMRHKPFGHN